MKIFYNFFQKLMFWYNYIVCDNYKNFKCGINLLPKIYKLH